VVAWPPAACTNHVRDFVDVAEGVQHVRTGDRRVTIIRVLLRFDGHHQATILKERDSTIMAGIIREDSHVASASAANDSRRSIPYPIGEFATGGEMHPVADLLFGHRY
jgi:hypothetical protein